MTVTSFWFIFLLLCGTIVYYIVPKKAQWIILLCLSVVFYIYAATPYTILYLIITSLLSYTAGIVIGYKDKIRLREKTVSFVVVAAIVINVLIWFILKGNSIWTLGFRGLHKLIPSIGVPQIELVAALGMGYYTAQAIGYILDVKWGILEPEKNLLKVFLFISFFPQLTVGPISKFSQLKSLFLPHDFQYKNICYGSQRILWGIVKKLVVSDRIAILVNGIWADTTIYTGIWPWVAVILYPIEIYTDFSGCVDIVIGAAELFDIKMPENFKNPFYSLTVQEFWQRWHITLGLWAKDYVYYPILKSQIMIKIGKWTKKRFSKRIGKFVPWAIGMGVLWFVMGFWHGSIRHIIGVSAWYWLVIVVSELFQPVLQKVTRFLMVDIESYSWKLFQRLRTYFIFSIGCVFFVSTGIHDVVIRYKTLLFNIKPSNYWTLFDGTILNLGLTWGDINIVILCCLMIVVVAYLSEKYGYARIWISKQILPFRWMIWIVLFIILIIYGHYGPGYDSSQFIYQGF